MAARSGSCVCVDVAVSLGEGVLVEYAVCEAELEEEAEWVALVDFVALILLVILLLEDDEDDGIELRVLDDDAFALFVALVLDDG